MVDHAGDGIDEVRHDAGESSVQGVAVDEHDVLVQLAECAHLFGAELTDGDDAVGVFEIGVGRIVEHACDGVAELFEPTFDADADGIVVEILQLLAFGVPLDDNDAALLLGFPAGFAVLLVAELFGGGEDLLAGVLVDRHGRVFIEHAGYGGDGDSDDGGDVFDGRY